MHLYVLRAHWITALTCAAEEHKTKNVSHRLGHLCTVTVIYLYYASMYMHLLCAPVYPSFPPDVLYLVDPSILTPEKEAALLARTNKEKFAIVTAEGRKVLLTPKGELPNGTFLDPNDGGSVLTVNHKGLTATRSGEPLSAEQRNSIVLSTPLRDEVDAQMQRYCSEWLPGGVCTTYGSAGSSVKVVCCISVLDAELCNYWAGAYRAEWTLEVPAGGSTGQLTGKIFINVHYFEDGNVQLDDKAVLRMRAERL